jgi:hypothetical protein
MQSVYLCGTCFQKKTVCELYVFRQLSLSTKTVWAKLRLSVDYGWYVSIMQPVFFMKYAFFMQYVFRQLSLSTKNGVSLSLGLAYTMAQRRLYGNRIVIVFLHEIPQNSNI